MPHTRKQLYVMILTFGFGFFVFFLLISATRHLLWPEPPAGIPGTAVTTTTLLRGNAAGLPAFSMPTASDGFSLDDPIDGMVPQQTIVSAGVPFIGTTTVITMDSTGGLTKTIPISQGGTGTVFRLLCDNPSSTKCYNMDTKEVWAVHKEEQVESPPSDQTHDVTWRLPAYRGGECKTGHFPTAVLDTGVVICSKCAIGEVYISDEMGQPYCVSKDAATGLWQVLGRSPK